MKNTVQFLSQTFAHNRIARLEATLDTDLSCRSLNVDTAIVSLSTEDRKKPLLFFTSEPLPFFTRDAKRFYTAPDGEATPTIGTWSQVNALQILRGGSLMKTFFPQTVRRVSPIRTEVTLTSALGLLTQLSHKGGVYTGATGDNPMTAGGLIREICGYSGSTPGAVTVYASPEFESIAIYGWLPYVTPSGVAGSQRGSAKDNLLQVLFAINASLRASSDGTLRVENLSAASQSTIGKSRVYRENANVEELAPVTSVTVLEHQYIPGTETKTLFDGVTTAGQTIIFSEPMSNLVASGFTIAESGANYAVVSAGSGTLVGKPYVHITREITHTVSNSDAENEMRIEGATLVGITASSDVASRLAAFYACRKYINCDAVLSYEDAGNVVSLWDPFDLAMKSACIESISPVQFSNTLKGRIRALVGYTPWQVEPFEDVHTVITQSGTWTVPENVLPGTEVSVILIGGGQGGKPGNAGKAPSAPRTTTDNIDNSGSGPHYHRRYTVVDSLVGGEGGLPGDPGAGGNIYRLSVTVDPGDTFSITIGTGGAGAQYGTEDSGALGTDTTFGTHTSASGSSYSSGYLDIDGHLYGQTGDAGVTGGVGASYVDPDPDPIIVDGVSYSHGTKGGGAEGSKGTYNVNYGYFSYVSYGSYGGGAAYKGNGGNGAYGSGAFGYTGGNVSRVIAYSYAGGNGANAQKPDAQTNCGQGGTGGNGGGGQGGYGAAQANNNYESPATGGQNDVITAGSASPGNGSDGGDGAPGCVILYYRVPIEE